MGTPRASASLDQMRRIQISASGGGECATHSALNKTRNLVAASWVAGAAARAGAFVAMLLSSEPAFANGCTDGPVRSWDVSQQALLAQQSGWHIFSLGALERMHAAAETRIGATKSAVASIIAMLILLSIVSIS